MTQAAIDEERWGRLLEYLSQARARPSFETEERQYRLAIAEEVREIMGLAAAGGEWRQRLEAVFTGLFNRRRYDLTDLSPRRWVRTFPSPGALEAAMKLLLEMKSAPAERFGSFMRAAEEHQPSLATPAESLAAPDPDRETVLALGSLLIFACDPEGAPVIHPELWNRVERTLGLPITFRSSPAEEYARHLAFASEVQDRLRKSGVPVADMLDLQSLVHAAGMRPDFWAADPEKGYAPGDRSRAPRPKAYLSVCAIYRDEAADLAEWVEFHRLVGVERFFLYNNFSMDNHMEVLAPYIDEGLVTVRDWPVLDGRIGQIAAYDDALRWHRFDSRWIAFIDLDEFMFASGDEPLPEVLTEYERWPAVALRWVMIGTSGHEIRPEGLVIDNYRRRIDYDGNMNMKSIVDPSRVTRCLSGHHFEYPYLAAVDESHAPVNGTRTATGSVERLRINHYHWKSRQEYMAKCARSHASGRRSELPGEDYFEWLADAEARGTDDDAILRYLPDLRRALAARREPTG